MLTRLMDSTGRAVHRPFLARRARSVEALVAVALLAAFAGCKSPADRPACRVRPLHVGVCQLGADHVLGGEHTADERIEFVIYSFLVEGPGGETALIDLGPRSLEYTNAMFRRFGFFRDLGDDREGRARFPDDVQQPHGNVLEQLRELGHSPGDIDHVVFTHLHADHHGMHDATDGGVAEALPNAVLHVSRRGWEDNLARREDGRWASYVDHAFSDFLLRREAGGRARFEDDVEIFPGLRTVYLGGHSVCSQAVVVETEGGPLIIASDDIYLYRLLAESILPQIHTTPENLRAAVQRLVDLAKQEDGAILPLHDPLVWEAYQRNADTWISTLRDLTKNAIASYEDLRPNP